MTRAQTSFRTVLEKYLLYADALKQYLNLEEEDKKVLEPYIHSLKQQWQQQLKETLERLRAGAKPRLMG